MRIQLMLCLLLVLSCHVLKTLITCNSSMFKTCFNSKNQIKSNQAVSSVLARLALESGLKIELHNDSGRGSLGRSSRDGGEGPSVWRVFKTAFSASFDLTFMSKAIKTHPHVELLWWLYSSPWSPRSSASESASPLRPPFRTRSKWENLSPHHRSGHWGSIAKEEN